VLSSDIDYRGLARLLHIHLYSWNNALTNLIGDMQALMMHSYAENVTRLWELHGLDIRGLKDLRDELVKIGLLEDLYVRKLACEREGEVVLVVEHCRMAPLVHRPMGLIGLPKSLCPLASMAMVALALERGWRPGKPIFDYVRFAKQLTRFTEDGSETTFELPPIPVSKPIKH